MADIPTVEQRAAHLVRRIEEEVTGAYADFGRRILIYPGNSSYLRKCVLSHLGEYFDIHAKWYLSEVSEYEQIQSWYGPLLVELATRTITRSATMHTDWPILARVGVHGTMQVLLQSRIEHWRAAAFRKVREIEEFRSNKQPEAEKRRAYRPEVRAWMKRNGITSVAVAAKRLGVSDSTLKSIMTDKGTTRYSPETLAAVLKVVMTGE